VFTLYFGFPQFSRFKFAIDLVRGRYTDPNKREPGETSHFQALATAL
jgi:AGCS family alanine or glycine:cation symporter